MTKSEYITNYIVEGKGTLKEAEAAWKAYREENGAGNSVANAFYTELKEGVMDDIEFDTWLGAQSNNVQKHKSHYNAIRALANHIHNIYE